VGTALDAANVRRVAAAAGLDAQAWTPRELRHSFVSLLSSTGMSIEDISCPTSTSGPADLAVERRPKRRDPPSGRRLPR
jgi:hypothetical protein